VVTQHLRAVVSAVSLGVALLVPAEARADSPLEQSSKPAMDPRSAPTAAEDGAEAQAERPRKRQKVPNEARLHHAALSVAPAHEALDLRARIDHPELVKRAVVVYRTARRSTVEEITFRRAEPSGYIAQVPGEIVKPAWIEYAIELEGLDGTRTPVLGTRQAMHRVHVRDDLDDARERALATRLAERRSVFFTSAEYVDFGTSEAETEDDGGVVRTLAVEDRFYRVEGGYTYRPLRLVTEFSLRLGIVRGQSPVPLGPPAPGQSEADRFKVGLNYGAPTVRFRLHDIVHMEGEFLTSVTEVGFSVGAGAAVLVGDPYGSKLTLGVEGIEVFGVRFFSRMDIVATPSFTVAPIVEVTNMPHADQYGVRLLGEIEWAVGGGFSAAARGGYQARLFTAGGPSAGVALRYAF
jgi:hypothetical protein